MFRGPDSEKMVLREIGISTATAECVGKLIAQADRHWTPSSPLHSINAWLEKQPSQKITMAVFSNCFKHLYTNILPIGI